MTCELPTLKRFPSIGSGQYTLGSWGRLPYPPTPAVPVIVTDHTATPSPGSCWIMPALCSALWACPANPLPADLIAGVFMQYELDWCNGKSFFLSFGSFFSLALTDELMFKLLQGDFLFKPQQFYLVLVIDLFVISFMHLLIQSFVCLVNYSLFIHSLTNSFIVAFMHSFSYCLHWARLWYYWALLWMLARFLLEVLKGCGCLKTKY